MNRAVAGWSAAVLLCAFASESPAEPTRVSGVHTNWVDRWVTNTVDVYMQMNRFVTEYHTNCVTAVHTNYVDLFQTNVVTKTVTNTLFVQAMHTNFVQAYRTNLQTLHLTNWTTVLAFKTNWVTKPITNLVEIEMIRDPAPSAAVAPANKPALTSEALALEATRTARPATSSQVEVQLKVAWTHGAPSPVQVQQWRIEREDGSFLCFGQNSEFRRTLATGTYRVTVKAQRDAKSPLVAALGVLTVTPQEVSLEQKPARSNSAI